MYVLRFALICPSQGLTYTGFIDLKWQKIHKTIEMHCDINKDGWVRGERRWNALQLQTRKGVREKREGHGLQW